MPNVQIFTKGGGYPHLQITFAPDLNEQDVTPEEAHYLLEHVRTHERPVLDSVLDGCMRDGDGQGWMTDPNLPKGEDGERADYQTIFDYWMRIHPLETKAFEQRYYQNLWQVEAEILHRIRLCVARGWGMIQTCYH